MATHAALQHALVENKNALIQWSSAGVALTGHNMCPITLKSI